MLCVSVMNPCRAVGRSDPRSASPMDSVRHMARWARGSGDMRNFCPTGHVEVPGMHLVCLIIEMCRIVVVQTPQNTDGANAQNGCADIPPGASSGHKSLDQFKHRSHHDSARNPVSPKKPRKTLSLSPSPSLVLSLSLPLSPPGVTKGCRTWRIGVPTIHSFRDKKQPRLVTTVNRTILFNQDIAGVHLSCR